MILIDTAIACIILAGVYLAYEWGQAALQKYKKDNDLN